MPYKKVPCPQCGKPKSRFAELCRECKPSYERTAANRKKMSEATIGKPKPWLKGKKRPDVAKKIAAAWADPEKREVARQRGLKFSLDRAWRDLIAKSLVGELNPNYQGKGKGSAYSPGFGHKHRYLIKQRDGFRCQRCGSRKNLDVHHIDGSKTNHHPDNLITLCRKCHANDPIDRRNNKSIPG